MLSINIPPHSIFSWLVVVVGHTQCGGVAGAYDAALAQQAAQKSKEEKGETDEGELPSLFGLLHISFFFVLSA